MLGPWSKNGSLYTTILILLIVQREDKAKRECLIEHDEGVKLVSRMPEGLWSGSDTSLAKSAQGFGAETIMQNLEVVEQHQRDCSIDRNYGAAH